MKKENNKLIPKLRFREFEGEWQKDSTKKLVSFIKDGTHGTHKDTPDGGHYLLSAKNIVNGAIILNDDERKISKSEFDKITRSYRLKENDILVTIVGSIGQLALHKHQTNYAFQRSVAFLRFSKIEPKYAFHYLNSYYYQNELMKRKVTSAQPGIYLGELSKIDISFPSHPEQQKIASFLTAVDKRIEQLTKKKKLLEEYKKGVMQKMFNQEIRFKDENGNDFPEWEEKRLSKLADINKGTQKNADQLSQTGKYPVINGGKEPSGYFDEFNTEAETITISEGGNSCGFVNYLESPFWSGGHCYTLKINSSVHKKYLYHYLKHYETEIMKLRVGSGLPNIQKKDIESFEVQVPSPRQQTHIASFVDKIEQQYKAFDMSTDQMTSFKQGLLQQMFI